MILPKQFPVLLVEIYELMQQVGKANRRVELD